MIAFSSRVSLAKTISELRGLQRDVYLAIRDWPHPHLGPSLQELAEKLDRKECSICGRLNELRAAGCIQDAPLKIGACGKATKTYRALAWHEPIPAEEPQLTLL